MPVGALAVVLAIFGGLLLAIESGYRLGRHAVKSDRRSGDSKTGAHTGAVQGATLGLLGLLLGFSFAGAAGRYIERQDLITSEANAISTAYLRAELLPAPHGEDLRGALRDYVAHRIEISQSLKLSLTDEDVARIAGFHDRIWRAASGGVREQPGLATPLLNPVNDVLDLHASRVATGHKHLPGLVLGLLALCAALAMGSMGYGCGLMGRRNLSITAPLAVLIGAAMWTTIDLDYARIGLIRVSDQALLDLDLR